MTRTERKARNRARMADRLAAEIRAEERTAARYTRDAAEATQAWRYEHDRDQADRAARRLSRLRDFQARSQGREVSR